MRHIDIVRNMLLSLAVSFAAGLLFVNVYNSVVDAANWGQMLPGSVEAARHYFKAADPGTFFRVASPLNQLIALFALALCWKVSPRLRLLCGAGLVLAVAGDVFTYAFFIPRNAILFQNPMEGNLEAIRSAGTQWMAMNWVRSGMVGLNVLANFMALYTLLRIQFAAASPSSSRTAPVSA